jgi:hypothetical protein
MSHSIRGAHIAVTGGATHRRARLAGDHLWKAVRAFAEIQTGRGERALVLRKQTTGRGIKASVSCAIGLLTVS